MNLIGIVERRDEVGGWLLKVNKNGVVVVVAWRRLVG